MFPDAEYRRPLHTGEIAMIQEAYDKMSKPKGWVFSVNGRVAILTHTDTDGDSCTLEADVWTDNHIEPALTALIRQAKEHTRRLHMLKAAR